MEEKLAKTVLTTGIGAIAEIEKTFGHLWGHNNDDLTENQRKWLDAWKDARNRILRNCNSQIRLLKKIYNDAHKGRKVD